LLALYYYTLPIWGEIEVLEALQNALLYTGLALSFMSLIENKKTLDPKHQKLLFTLLIAFTLLMFGMGFYWLFTAPEAYGLAQSLIVLGIGMLSVLKMIIPAPNAHK